MSRIAKAPVTIPGGVEVKISGQTVSAKGPKGSLSMNVNALVEVAQNDGLLVVKPLVEDVKSWTQAGTARSLVNNLVLGVSAGFEKKLQLIGVGYRAKADGNTVNSTLGFSHPVDYVLPEGISVVTPSQTEIVLSGVDKQRVGQVAAEIRAFRPPEPYKGKGIRYADEAVRRKEAKKK